MQILQEPDQRLLTKSDEIKNLNEARKIAKELIAVTKRVDRPYKLWLGMASPQIGYNKRLILLRKSYHNYEVMVNPEVLQQKWRFPIPVKCYSVRGLYLVKYHFWFKVRYQDLDGEYHTKVIRGGRAAALNQEMDHLNGLLISKIGRCLF